MRVAKILTFTFALPTAILIAAMITFLIQGRPIFDFNFEAGGGYLIGMILAGTFCGWVYTQKTEPKWFK